MFFVAKGVWSGGEGCGRVWRGVVRRGGVYRGCGGVSFHTHAHPTPHTLPIHTIHPHVPSVVLSEPDRDALIICGIQNTRASIEDAMKNLHKKREGR